MSLARVCTASVMIRLTRRTIGASPSSTLADVLPLPWSSSGASASMLAMVLERTSPSGLTNLSMKRLTLATGASNGTISRFSRNRSRSSVSRSSGSVMMTFSRGPSSANGITRYSSTSFAGMSARDSRSTLCLSKSMYSSPNWLASALATSSSLHSSSSTSASPVRLLCSLAYAKASARELGSIRPQPTSVSPSFLRVLAIEPFSSTSRDKAGRAARLRYPVPVCGSHRQVSMGIPATDCSDPFRPVQLGRRGGVDASRVGGDDAAEARVGCLARQRGGKGHRRCCCDSLCPFMVGKSRPIKRGRFRRTWRTAFCAVVELERSASWRAWTAASGMPDGSASGEWFFGTCRLGGRSNITLSPARCGFHTFPGCFPFGRRLRCFRRFDGFGKRRTC